MPLTHTLLLCTTVSSVSRPALYASPRTTILSPFTQHLLVRGVSKRTTYDVYHVYDVPNNHSTRSHIRNPYALSQIPLPERLFSLKLATDSRSRESGASASTPTKLTRPAKTQGLKPTSTRSYKNPSALVSGDVNTESSLTRYPRRNNRAGLISRGSVISEEKVTSSLSRHRHNSRTSYTSRYPDGEGIRASQDGVKRESTLRRAHRQAGTAETKLSLLKQSAPTGIQTKSTAPTTTPKPVKSTQLHVERKPNVSSSTVKTTQIPSGMTSAGKTLPKAQAKKAYVAPLVVKSVSAKTPTNKSTVIGRSPQLENTKVTKASLVTKSVGTDSFLNTKQPVSNSYTQGGGAKPMTSTSANQRNEKRRVSRTHSSRHKGPLSQQSTPKLAGRANKRIVYSTLTLASWIARKERLSKHLFKQIKRRRRRLQFGVRPLQWRFRYYQRQKPLSMSSKLRPGQWKNFKNKVARTRQRLTQLLPRALARARRRRRPLNARWRRIRRAWFTRRRPYLLPGPRFARRPTRRALTKKLSNLTRFNRRLATGVHLRWLTNFRRAKLHARKVSRSRKTIQSAIKIETPRTRIARGRLRKRRWRVLRRHMRRKYAVYRRRKTLRFSLQTRHRKSMMWERRLRLRLLKARPWYNKRHRKRSKSLFTTQGSSKLRWWSRMGRVRGGYSELNKFPATRGRLLSAKRLRQVQAKVASRWAHLTALKPNFDQTRLLRTGYRKRLSLRASHMLRKDHLRRGPLRKGPLRKAQLDSREVQYQLNLRRSFVSQLSNYVNRSNTGALAVRPNYRPSDILKRLPLSAASVVRSGRRFMGKANTLPVKPRTAYYHSRSTRGITTFFKDTLTANYTKRLPTSYGWRALTAPHILLDSYVGKLSYTTIQPIIDGLYSSVSNFIPHTINVAIDSSRNLYQFDATQSLAQLSYDRILCDWLTRTGTNYTTQLLRTSSATSIKPSTSLPTQNYLTGAPLTGTALSKLALIAPFMRGHVSQIRGPQSPARRRAGISVENIWSFSLNEERIPGVAIDGTGRGLFRMYSGGLLRKTNLRRSLPNTQGSLGYPGSRIRPIMAVLNLFGEVQTPGRFSNPIELKSLHQWVSLDRWGNYVPPKETGVHYFMGGLIRWVVGRTILNPKTRRLRNVRKRRRQRRRPYNRFVSVRRRRTHSRPMWVQSRTWKRYYARSKRKFKDLLIRRRYNRIRRRPRLKFRLANPRSFRKRQYVGRSDRPQSKALRSRKGYRISKPLPLVARLPRILPRWNHMRDGRLMGRHRSRIKVPTTLRLLYHFQKRRRRFIRRRFRRRVLASVKYGRTSATKRLRRQATYSIGGFSPYNPNGSVATSRATLSSVFNTSLDPTNNTRTQALITKSWSNCGRGLSSTFYSTQQNILGFITLWGRSARILKWNLLNLNASDTRMYLPLRPRATISTWHNIQKLYLRGSDLSTNLIPHPTFKARIAKAVSGRDAANRNYSGASAWIYLTIIDFLEHITGSKVLYQLYPAINKNMSLRHAARYMDWTFRLAYWDRRLGHRFFLEESLHIMHFSFTLRDPRMMIRWLRAMILRISFWKTRSIFRYLRQLFKDWFIDSFEDISVWGVKVKLKGKISVAGNSRKRTIRYRWGKTSHSNTSLRVRHEFITVGTFTGVMGLSLWLFY
jgi:hypothetical protein